MGKKVFIGVTDIASVVSEFKEGFAQIGIETLTVSQNLSTVLQDMNTDFVIPYENTIQNKWLYKFAPSSFKHLFEITPTQQKEKIFKKALKECDTFIFIWNSLLPNWEDLALLKTHKKKIVFLAMGSDVRIRPAYEQEMQTFNIPSYYKLLDPNNDIPAYQDYNFQIANMRATEKYADLIFNLHNQGQLALRPYLHFYIPVLSKYIEEKHIQNEIPIVAHAPSRRGVKGTEIILQVVEQLQEERIPFKFELIENVPHQEALKMYENVDIVLGELFIPSGGKLEREVLAAGKISMSCMPTHYKDKIPSDCPIIDINPNNLYEELKKIILDYPKRNQLAKQGKKYITKYHESATVGKKIMDLLDTEPNNLQYDYFPDFFRQKFLPLPKDIPLFNQWTNYVKDCDWYKKYVPEGKREGLIF